jgi:hypothetical protein
MIGRPLFAYSESLVTPSPVIISLTPTIRALNACLFGANTPFETYASGKLKLSGLRYSYVKPGNVSFLSLACPIKMVTYRLLVDLKVNIEL